MGAAPGADGRNRHIEEVGDVLQREAVAAEFPRLGGEQVLVAVGD